MKILLNSLLKKKLKKFRTIKPILTFSDGCKYSGMTKKNNKNIKKLIPEGLGYAIWPDGNYYEGQYKNGTFNGWGNYVSPGSHKLTGIWKNGFIIKGEMKWEDGRYYVGEFKKSKFHGKGTMIVPDSYKYEGQWKDNLEHGKGKMTYLIDSKEKNWEKGTILKGEFARGLQHGRFEKIFPDGEVMDLVFENNFNTKSKFRDQKKWTVYK